MLDRRQIKRPSIENQIESMLDKLMDEESFTDQEEQWEFSDDENENPIDITFPKSNSAYFANQFRQNHRRTFSNVQKPMSFFGKAQKKQVNVNSPNETFDTRWSLNLTDTMFEQNQFGGMNKRFRTVSFNNNKEVPNENYYNQYYVPCQQMSGQPVYFDTSYCSFISSTSTLDEYYQRNDFRGNTVDIIQGNTMNNKQNVLAFNNNFMHSTNNSNISINNINNSSSFILQGRNQQSSPSSMNCSYNSNFNNNSNPNICASETDMQLELLWLKINKNITKTEKIDHYIFSKLQNKLLSIIQTHKGSKLFQTYLPNTQSEIIHLILNELSPSLAEWMQNWYGNYFCKLLFTWLNQKDRIEFLKSIQPNLVKLSIDCIGTYPWQSIIECVGSKWEKK